MGNQGIDQRALDSLSVAPDEKADTGTQEPGQDAGQDRAINKRLKRNPEDKDAQLDNALDESMDASDPPSNTQPPRSSSRAGRMPCSSSGSGAR